MRPIYFLTVIDEGIILSRGDEVWFYSWYGLEGIPQLEGFL